MDITDAIKIAHYSLEKFKMIYSDSLEACYLIGSYARGDYDDESDINFLFVIDSHINTIYSYDKQIAHISSELSLQYEKTISFSVTTVSMFESFIYDDIRSLGILIQ